MPRLLTYEQAAEELNVSVGWLKKKVAARAIPFRRLGDLVRFSESDLEAIADQAAFSPNSKPRRGHR
jgi:excisionase family DNA binding protein